MISSKRMDKFYRDYDRSLNQSRRKAWWFVPDASMRDRQCITRRQAYRYGIVT